MKTHLLAAACIAASLVSFGATAQTRAYQDYEFDTPFWGVRAAVDMSCPGNWKIGDHPYKMFGNAAGGSATVIYNYPFGGGFYVEPGVGFFYDTMNADYATKGPDGPIGSLDRLDAWVGTWGMRVPLMAGYRIDFTPSTALFLSTGPQLEVGFSSHLSDDMPGGSSLAGELYDDLFHRVDLQWKVGGGVAFNRNYYIGVEAAIGLLNLAKGNTVTFHRDIVTFTIGYNF